MELHNTLCNGQPEPGALSITSGLVPAIEAFKHLIRVQPAGICCLVCNADMELAGEFCFCRYCYRSRFVGISAGIVEQVLEYPDHLVRIDVGCIGFCFVEVR